MNSAIFILGFAIYLTGMITIGMFCSRGKSKGSDFLTGGGRLPFYLIFATLTASFIGTGSSVGATANGLKYGFGACVFGLGSALGLVVLVWSVKERDIRGKGFQTMAEEAQFLYGGRKEIKYLFAVLMMVGQTVALGTHITGGATYFSYITGIDMVTAKMITVLAFGVYLIIGGYLAVVWTDLIQMVILLAGFVSITLIVIPKAGGWTEIVNTLQAQGAGGSLSFYGVKSMGICTVLSTAAAAFLTQNGSSVVRFRMYTAMDDRTARRGLLCAAAVSFLFSFIPALLGMAAFTIATKEGFREVFANPDFTFSFLALHVLGPVTGLLFLISGLSATLSSGDSDTIATVTIFIDDLIPMITGKRVREENLSKVSRIAALGILCLAFLSTLAADNIMSYITNVMGAVSPAMAVVMLLGNRWKLATWQGAMVSTVAGSVLGLAYLTVPPVKSFITDYFGGPAIAVGVLTLLVLVIVSSLTPREQLSDQERMAKVIEQRRLRL